MRAQTEKWKAGIGKNDDVQNEAEGDKALRDYAKARKFNQMMSKGSLPLGVMELVKEVEKSDAPRQNKTALINSLFTKRADGSLSLNTEGQEYQSFKSQFLEKKDSDKVEGEPYHVFLYKNFHGDQEGLKLALAAGEVKEVDRDGVKYLCYHKFQVKTSKGNNETTTLHAKQSLDKSSYELSAAMFGMIQKKNEEASAAGEPASKRVKLKALEEITSL